MSNAKKEGNKFQEDFEKSVPSELLCERYKDAPSRFKKVHNPSDYWINSGNFVLLVECKTTKNKSLPLANIGMEQVWKMIERAYKKNTFGGFAINFRSIEETYFVFLEDFIYWYLFIHDRESLSLSWIRQHGYRINSWKRRTRYRYDVVGLLEWVSEHKYVKEENI